MSSSDKEQKNSNSEVKHRIDITEDRCPMTFVRTRLALDKMLVGEKLEVILRGGEPAQNVPKSAKELGHIVGPLNAISENLFSLIIEKT
ncbi:MAG: sulfurtransferase TusA family protein [Rhodospirillales bacterium]|jgi:tRNA 2-thiouridine synthesizing protein A